MLRRRKVLGKMVAKAEGPFKVIKAAGTYRQSITLQPLDLLIGPKKKAE